MIKSYSILEPRVKLYDKDIREPLFDYLEERFGKTRIFEEKIIGRSRADIIMLTEERIIGIEIKSDADTYNRLNQQIRNYNKYCDRNYVVVGKSHEKHIEEHVPKWWGIVIIFVENGNVNIEQMREAEDNPKMKKELQITMLWRPELQHILEKNHLPKYRQKSKKFVRQKLMEKVEWSQLKLQMCEEIFQRDYTLWEDEMETYRKSQHGTPEG